MKKELREKAIKLRIEKEMSYSAIKKQLGVSKSTLSYWLGEYPLSEEKILELRRKGWKKGEVSRERYRNTMREKKENIKNDIYKKELKKFKIINRQSYYVAGLMLYLAEGAKKKDGQINIANTDPKIILFFIKWLDDFLGIAKKKIKIQLHLYENMDIAKETVFWKNVLCISNDQLYKVQVRELKKGSFSYKYSHGHGTCSLYAIGTVNKTKLMMAIKAFIDTVVK